MNSLVPRAQEASQSFGLRDQRLQTSMNDLIEPLPQINCSSSSTINSNQQQSIITFRRTNNRPPYITRKSSQNGRSTHKSAGKHHNSDSQNASVHVKGHCAPTSSTAANQLSIEPIPHLRRENELKNSLLQHILDPTVGMGHQGSQHSNNNSTIGNQTNSIYNNETVKISAGGLSCGMQCRESGCTSSSNNASAVSSINLIQQALNGGNPVHSASNINLNSARFYQINQIKRISFNDTHRGFSQTLQTEPSYLPLPPINPEVKAARNDELCGASPMEILQCHENLDDDVGQEVMGKNPVLQSNFHAKQGHFIQAEADAYQTFKEQLQKKQTPVQFNAFTEYFSGQTKEENKINDVLANGGYYQPEKGQVIPNTIYVEGLLKIMVGIQKQFSPSNFLNEHDVEPQMRAKMVDWMIEVLCSYKCTDQSFFMAVSIMDRYFENVKHSIEIHQLHSIGVTSMFIACQYEEVYPMRLKTFHEKIAHKKLSVNDIKLRELDILEALQFQITGCTLHDLLSLLLQSLYMKNQLQNVPFQFFSQLTVYLAQMAMHSYDLLNTVSYRALAGACIYVSLKIIEQMNFQISLTQINSEIRVLLDLENQALINASTFLLYLAQNSENILRGFNNLQKYNEGVLRELEEIKKDHAQKLMNKETTEFSHPPQPQPQQQQQLQIGVSLVPVKKKPQHKFE